ncbi:hypothetical protein DPMN_068699 [Dreissena polymorpha]|uniref:Uncharacterized protein n=1 Tax=Dreissena polymorpha TaxID=45954 RepID=A0A9D3YZN6_DREPO|nr:hypothetical protein DPMN_068699 [Dreissena polymorpha]
MEIPCKSRKREAFAEIIKDIDVKVLSGETLVISDLRVKANGYIATSDSPFTNKEIRLRLINHYGLCLIFLESKGSASTVFYMEGKKQISDCTSSQKDKVCIDRCAEIIQTELKNCDFELNEKFCDAVDLKESWENTKIPELLLRFLGKVFNFDSKFYYEEQGEETDGDNDYPNRKGNSIQV